MTSSKGLVHEKSLDAACGSSDGADIESEGSISDALHGQRQRNKEYMG